MARVRILRPLLIPLLLVTLVALFLFCKPVVSQRIEGVLVDGLTGEPIAGALVEYRLSTRRNIALISGGPKNFAKRFTVTDREGRFHFEDEVVAWLHERWDITTDSDGLSAVHPDYGGFGLTLSVDDLKADASHRKGGPFQAPDEMLQIKIGLECEHDPAVPCQYEGDKFRYCGRGHFIKGKRPGQCTDLPEPGPLRFEVGWGADKDHEMAKGGHVEQTDSGLLSCVWLNRNEFEPVSPRSRALQGIRYECILPFGDGLIDSRKFEDLDGLIEYFQEKYEIEFPAEWLQ